MVDDVIARLLHDGCGYCPRSFTEDELASEFWSVHEHYKSIQCNGCGSKNWAKVTFFGSGHDRNSQGELESIVRKVNEAERQ